MENRKIIDTHHAIIRFAERFKNSEEVRKELTQVIIRGMKAIMSKYLDNSAIYGIYSYSTGLSAIINWRPDKYNRSDKRNHAIVITIPPIKERFEDFKTISPSDIRLQVESHLKQLVPSNKIKESHSYIQTINVNGLKMFLLEGEIYDYGIDYYVGVE